MSQFFSSILSFVLLILFILFFFNSFVLYSQLTFIHICSLFLLFLFSSFSSSCSFIFYLYNSEMGDRIALQYGGSEAHKKVTVTSITPFLHSILYHPILSLIPIHFIPFPYILYLRPSFYHTNYLYLLDLYLISNSSLPSYHLSLLANLLSFTSYIGVIRAGRTSDLLFFKTRRAPHFNKEASHPILLFL
jgi:hypothetical protein